MSEEKKEIKIESGNVDILTISLLNDISAKLSLILEELKK